MRASLSKGHVISQFAGDICVTALIIFFNTKPGVCMERLLLWGFYFLVTDATRLKTNLRLTTVCSTFLNRSLIFVCVCVCVCVRSYERNNNFIVSETNFTFQVQLLRFK